MAATHNTPTVQRISGVHCNEPIMVADVHEGNAGQAINYIDTIVSSGVTTQFCAPWFAQEFPIQTLTADKEPQLSESRLEKALNLPSQKNNQQWSMQEASTQHWSRSTVCTISKQQWHQYYPIAHYGYNDTTYKWGNNSSDCTKHKYNTRSRTLLEETATTGRKATRNTWQESTRYTQDMPSSNKRVGELQGNNCERLDKNNEDFEHHNNRN